MNEKIIAFEYIITLLINWLRELTGLDEETALKEFNKLKLFKLHFFVSAINVSTDPDNNHDLLETFDAFYALPYGPVESYIYNHINELHIFSISNRGISRTQNNDDDQYFGALRQELCDSIDNAVATLRRKNDDLVAYTAFDLVELSHQWPVWRVLYDRALKSGKKSIPMPTSLIRASSKVFY